MWTVSGHASGNAGSGSFESSAIRRSSSSTPHGIRRRRRSTQVEAAPSSASAVVSIPAATRAPPCRPPARTRPGARSCAGGLVVAVPVVPRRDVAGAALEEDALDTRHAGLDRLAQRPREVRVPEQALAADQRRMAGEADDDGERVPVLAVHAQHRDAVVHRALALHPVDADPRCTTGSPADARRLPPAPGRVHGSREQVGQDSTHGANEPVSASPATVEPRETLGALWLCAAFTSTASGGIPVSSRRAHVLRRSCPRRRRRGRSR